MTGAERDLVPEGVVEPSWLEGTIGMRFRTRFIRDLFVDEAGGRGKALFAATGGDILLRRRTKRKVRFHGNNLCFYDLGSLNTS